MVDLELRKDAHFALHFFCFGFSGTRCMYWHRMESQCKGNIASSVRSPVINKTSSSAIAEGPRVVTSIRKIAKWNFSATLLGA